MALVSVGRIARVRGNYPAARRYDMEAIPVFEALGDHFWLARTYHQLGIAAFYEGDLATARERYETSLAIFERLHDELGIVTVLEELGEVAYLQGELDAARSLLGTTLQMARRIDDKDRIAMALAAPGRRGCRPGPGDASAPPGRRRGCAQRVDRAEQLTGLARQLQAVAGAGRGPTAPTRPRRRKRRSGDVARRGDRVRARRRPGDLVSRWLTPAWRLALTSSTLLPSLDSEIPLIASAVAARLCRPFFSRTSSNLTLPCSLPASSPSTRYLSLPLPWSSSTTSRTWKSPAFVVAPFLMTTVTSFRPSRQSSVPSCGVPLILIALTVRSGRAWAWLGAGATAVYVCS